jgi:hypothetical protein
LAPLTVAFAGDSHCISNLLLWLDFIAHTTLSLLSPLIFSRKKKQLGCGIKSACPLAAR